MTQESAIFILREFGRDSAFEGISSLIYNNYGNEVGDCEVIHGFIGLDLLGKQKGKKWRKHFDTRNHKTRITESQNHKKP